MTGVILPSVEHALLEGAVDFALGHGGGDGAHGVEGVHHELAVHDADLEAFQVLGLRDGTLVVDEVSGAAVAPVERRTPALSMSALSISPALPLRA